MAQVSYVQLVIEQAELFRAHLPENVNPFLMHPLKLEKIFGQIPLWWLPAGQKPQGTVILNPMATPIFLESMLVEMWIPRQYEGLYIEREWFHDTGDVHVVIERMVGARKQSDSEKDEVLAMGAIAFSLPHKAFWRHYFRADSLKWQHSQRMNHEALPNPTSFSLAQYFQEGRQHPWVNPFLPVLD